MSKRPIRLPGSLCEALVIICVLLPIGARGDSSQTEEEKLGAVKCLLEGGELKLRTAEVSKWFFQYEDIIVYEDGYSFRFPGKDEWFQRIVEFIASERRCCNFMKFKVTIEPNSGPIWLYIGGSAEIKDYLDTLIK